MPKAFTYLIHVTQANPDLLPFPKRFAAWKEGYEVDVLAGDLEEGQQQEVRLKLPGAKKVMVVTADEKQTQISKVTIGSRYVAVKTWCTLF